MVFDAARASALASALVPIFVCMAAGSAVGRGNDRWPGADLLVGFGLLGGALTILAVATPIPLSGLMIALAVLSIVALAIRRQIPGGSGTWIALALVSPILVHASGNQAALWDEFWNWLPSANYAISHDSLFKLGLPPSFSILPAYPQAVPLIIAAASLVAGRLLEAAGPVVNVALLAAVSALLADAMAAALSRQGRLATAGRSLVLVASAVAVTILLNPGLDGNVVQSSYADCGTMVAVGALGLLGVEMLAHLAGRGAGKTESLAWRFGCVGALLVNLKQANPVLLALVTLGLAAVTWRDPAIAKRRALAQLPRMLGPAIIVFVVWRWYVMKNVPQGEMAFRRFDAWNFKFVPNMLQSIAEVIAGAPLFHAMMWIVTAAGLAAFFTLPRKASEARWLAVVCATVWLGYNVFLLIVYLGAMSDSEMEMAADYWRYTPHAALLALYAPVMALATVHWPTWTRLRGAAPALAASLLALSALPVRGDLNNPRDRAWPHFIRAAITDMDHVIPPGSHVAIIPCWNGSPFGVIVRYGLWQLGVSEREIHGIILWDRADFPTVASSAARGEVNYLVIQDGEGAMDGLTDTLGLPRLDHELALFAWRDNEWQKVKSWPIPQALIVRDR